MVYSIILLVAYSNGLIVSKGTNSQNDSSKSMPIFPSSTRIVHSYDYQTTKTLKITLHQSIAFNKKKNSINNNSGAAHCSQEMRLKPNF